MNVDSMNGVEDNNIDAEGREFVKQERRRPKLPAFEIVPEEYPVVICGRPDAPAVIIPSDRVTVILDANMAYAIGDFIVSHKNECINKAVVAFGHVLVNETKY